MRSLTLDLTPVRKADWSAEKQAQLQRALHVFLPTLVGALGDCKLDIKLSTLSLGWSHNQHVLSADHY